MCCSYIASYLVNYLIFFWIYTKYIESSFRFSKELWALKNRSVRTVNEAWFFWLVLVHLLASVMFLIWSVVEVSYRNHLRFNYIIIYILFWFCIFVFRISNNKRKIFMARHSRENINWKMKQKKMFQHCFMNAISIRWDKICFLLKININH